MRPKNDDLGKIREAIIGQQTGGKLFKGPYGKGKGGPAPLRPEPLPPAPAPPPRQGRSLSDIVGGIVTLGVLAAIGIWILTADPGPFARPHSGAPAWYSGSGTDGGGSYSGSGGGTSVSGDSYVRPTTPRLKVSPRSGSVWRTLTFTGTGFPPDSEIRLVFHATEMGSARTSHKGRFTVRLKVPNAGFYAHFPGQTFSISTTYWSLDGAYRGNGPGASYHVT
ncbi:hypothetical protein [Planotetraspora sp. GP83]|uniref:hypothetical protein n=1 Tax=Planotetraspora sp. GP83 TaxID=3156264 RepID=UPI0035166E91